MGAKVAVDARGEEFFSLDGCQQGDPLGPFLWAVGYHQTLLELQAMHPTTLIVAYLDDTYSTDEVAEAYACMEDGARLTAAPYDAGGAEVLSNLGKQCIYSPEGDLDALPAALKGATRHAGGRLRGLKVLGAYVGDAEWCSRELVVRVERELADLRKVTALRDAGPRLNTAQQVKQMMLRYCVNTKLTYFLRAMPPAVTAAAARRQDELVSEALCGVFGTTGATAMEVELALMQARLPVKLGGCGMTSMEDIAGPACIGSWALCWPRLAHVDSSKRFDLPHAPYAGIDLLTSELEIVAQLREAHRQSLDSHAFVAGEYAALDRRLHDYAFDKEGRQQPRFHPDGLVSAEELAPLSAFGTDSEFLTHAQRRHSLVVHHSRWLYHLHRVLEVGRREAARFIAVSQPYAGHFLNAVPSRGPFRLASWAMHIAVQRRLGLPLYAARGLEGARDPDPLGDRASCNGEAGHAARHAALNRAVHETARDAWGSAARHEDPLYRGYSSSHRPDLTILYGLGGSHHIIGEVKLFDALAATAAAVDRRGAYVAFGNTREKARAQVLGRAQLGALGDGAFNRYTGKGYVPPLEGDYGDARRKHHEVALLLFETLGGFSPETVQFLLRARDLQNNKLSSAQYRLTTWSARSWMNYQCQRLSIALHRACAFEISCALGLYGASSSDEEGAAVGSSG